MMDIILFVGATIASCIISIIVGTVVAKQTIEFHKKNNKTMAQ